MLVSAPKAEVELTVTTLGNDTGVPADFTKAECGT